MFATLSYLTLVQTLTSTPVQNSIALSVMTKLLIDGPEPIIFNDVTEVEVMKINVSKSSGLNIDLETVFTYLWV